MESINEKIKRIRIEIGINQADVARSAGIKQSSYASIEKGDTKSISIEVGKGIAKALRLSFNELFDIENADAVDSLKEEIKLLRKRIDELEEQLDDKRKIILGYKDAADYLAMFTKFSLEILLVEKGEETEILDIPAMELFLEVDEMIKREKGDVFYTYNPDKRGFSIKFPSEDEMKLLNIAHNEAQKAKDLSKFNPNI